LEDLEKKLVEKYAYLRTRHDELKKEAANVWSEIEKITHELVEHMDDMGKDRTASYPGIGFISLALEINYTTNYEYEEELFSYLKSIDREDMIKTKVDANSMRALIKQTIKSEKEGDKDVPTLPNFLIYKMFMKPKLYRK